MGFGKTYTHPATTRRREFVSFCPPRPLHTPLRPAWRSSSPPFRRPFGSSSARPLKTKNKNKQKNAPLRPVRGGGKPPPFRRPVLRWLGRSLLARQTLAWSHSQQQVAGTSLRQDLVRVPLDASPGDPKSVNHTPLISFGSRFQLRPWVGFW